MLPFTNWILVSVFFPAVPISFALLYILHTIAAEHVSGVFFRTSVFLTITIPIGFFIDGIRHFLQCLAEWLASETKTKVWHRITMERIPKNMRESILTCKLERGIVCFLMFEFFSAFSCTLPAGLLMIQKEVAKLSDPERFVLLIVCTFISLFSFALSYHWLRYKLWIISEILPKLEPLPALNQAQKYYFTFLSVIIISLNTVLWCLVLKGSCHDLDISLPLTSFTLIPP